MTLYLAVRRAPAVLLTVAVMCFLLALAGDVAVPIPTLTGLGLALPLSVLLPIAVPIAVTWALEEGEPSLEAVASRPIVWLDLVAALAVVGAAALIAGGIGATVGPSPESYVAARNAIGYTGLALIARAAFGGGSAPLMPAAYAMGAVLFGTAATGEPHAWAWPISPPDAVSWILALVALAASCLAHLLVRPRPFR